MKKLLTSSLAAGALALSALASQAGTLGLNFDTLGAATFNRPTAEQDYPLTPDQVTPSAYENTSFFAQSFTVDLSGDYSFSITSANFDTYIVLYSTFNPSSPAENVIAVNDDSDSAVFGSSGLSAISLNAGTQYTFVTTGFSNEDFGGASASISGPGNISAIPEPQTALLFALAAGTVLFRIRRRSRA
jgi:hypothetical protein